MEKLDGIIFYTMDKAIRTYRQYAQKQLKLAGYTITIDQWLVIKSILENPGLPQQELATMIFKDNASVTRIIELCVKAKYLKRTISTTDRRRADLEVTAAGRKIISDVQKTVVKNRAVALAGIDQKSIAAMKNTLQAIITNCEQ
jgi:MarR family transcriptional regulator for hemolysin